MLPSAPNFEPDKPLRLTIVWSSTALIPVGSGTMYQVEPRTRKSVFDYTDIARRAAITQIMGDIELWKSKGYAWLEGQMVTFGQIDGLHISTIT